MAYFYGKDSRQVPERPAAALVQKVSMSLVALERMIPAPRVAPGR